MTPENPPAFPRDERYLGHNGMSLRDWFAGQALVGFMAGTAFPSLPSEVRAKACYSLADAMLIEKAKRDDT